MSKQVVKFTTAKLAYQKGYTRLTAGIPYTSVKRHYYNRDGELDGDVTYMVQAISNGEDVKGFIYDAPAQSTLQKWLREVHKMSVEVGSEYGLKSWGCYIVNEYNSSEPILNKDGNYFSSYEEALEEGLFQALKLINGSK